MAPASPPLANRPSCTRASLPTPSGLPADPQLPPRRPSLLPLPPLSVAQEHIMAERKRREKINQRFIELSIVIPGLKKMDKATILSHALKYVKEHQEKFKALEDRNLRSIQSVVLVRKLCTAVPEDDVDGCCLSAGAVAGRPMTGNALLEIESRISGSNVMVRIHYEDAKGVLVRLPAEVDGLHLSFVRANAILFPACTVVITVMAKAGSFKLLSVSPFHYSLQAFGRRYFVLL